MTNPFDLLTDAWQSGDASRVAALFIPNATWTIDGDVLSGDEIALAMGASLQARPHTRILLRRAFHDLQAPQWWVAEWALRSSADGTTWQEIEQGLLLQLAPDGRIASLRTHNDHATVREVQADAPLRAELWPEHVPPQSKPMTHDEILATQMKHVMSGWRVGSADTVVSCHGECSVIQTSLEVVRGHDQLRRSAQA